MSPEPDDALAAWLAGEARRLGLDATDPDGADEGRVRAFCAAVLRELAARGLVPGEPEIGCHARPRATGH